MGNRFSKAGAFFSFSVCFVSLTNYKIEDKKNEKEKKESNLKGKVAWNFFLLYLHDLRHTRCLPGVSHQAVLSRANNPWLSFVGGLRKNRNNNK